MGPKVKGSGSEKLNEQFDSLLSDIDKHMFDNTKYDTDIKTLSNLEGKIYGMFDDFYANQKEKGSGAISSMVDELKTTMYDYKKLRQHFTSFFNQRVKYDPNLIQSITSVDKITKFIEDDLLLGNGWIDEAEHNAILKARKMKSFTPIQEYINTQGALKANDMQELKKTALQHEKDFNISFPISQELFPAWATTGTLDENQLDRAIENYEQVLAKYAGGDTSGTYWKDYGTPMFEGRYSTHLGSTGKSDTFQERLKYWNTFLESQDVPYSPSFMRRVQKLATDADSKYADKNFGQGILGAQFYLNTGASSPQQDIPVSTRTIVQSSFDGLGVSNSSGVFKYPELASLKADKNPSGMESFYKLLQERTKELEGISLGRATDLRNEWNSFYNEVSKKFQGDEPSLGAKINNLNNFYKNIKSYY